MNNNSATYLIAGCGVSGRAAARLAARLGLRFSLLDEHDTADLRAFAGSLPYPPENIFYGFTPQSSLPQFDVLILSPGFRETNPVRPVLEQHAARITGELEFALEHCGKSYAAVTGTNGKTTTTELSSVLFCAAGLRAKACGNNGYAMSDAAIDCLDDRLDFPVVEVSSFQLETMRIPAPAAAAFLNLASDHIDRHGTMEAYAAAKFKLLANPGTSRVINANLTGIVPRFLPDHPGFQTFSGAQSADFHFAGGILMYQDRPIVAASELKLQGEHNIENALAALALLAAVQGAEAVFLPAVLNALKNFTSGEHRLEHFLTVNGIRFINDSKATNPHAVNAALKALGGSHRTILLLGGLDKDMDFKELLPCSEYIKQAFLFGTCAPRIRAAIEKVIPCTDCASFADAAAAAIQAAVPGDTVALSPATASMDMFRDYRDRGNQFKELCRKLTAASEDGQSALS